MDEGFAFQSVDSASFLRVGGLTCKVTGAFLPVSFQAFLWKDGFQDIGARPLLDDFDGKRSELFLDLTSLGDTRSTRCACVPEATVGDLEGERLYQAFGNALPLRYRVIFHGVAVKYRGAGYVFTASSGTGKSTHAFLWQRYLGRAVHILSGDKPVISGGGECGSSVTVWGSPWGGKERIFENGSAPLRGVCLIERGRTCAIERVEPAEFLETMLRQTFIPSEDPAATRALEVVDAVLANVPLWRLTCDMSEDAVLTSFEALTGLDYDTCRVGE